MSDWLTVVVEVGRNNPQRLANAALMWSQYPGMEYIECICVGPATNQRIDWWFKVYDMAPDALVEPSPTFTYPPPPGQIPEATIVLDTHRVLGVALANALPDGMADTMTIDMQEVMQLAPVDAPEGDARILSERTFRC
ncbi:Aste57867_16206 [Aphanomyces stellatus]|uniref:Aste57867_16206 protein n=1 Tax=Aphanomyces stellatus TaxID=120398 RepID=A0A485L5V8_9STRA|nr:hypothetical protein As57867_016150 [Aphanomyces stellatus]VFT92984.1 Aste57867_16206 [Aphanomyces stellatus]